ncbi:hypothetical protein SORBI_3003G133100 [Sorghum bicolor]|nr:hypothetical protein SORBI_3003G133100 [Sorghum bicolor]
MIRDMNIAKREEDIGFYAGFVGASYFSGRTFSSVPWGIFADKYGRKPCIVISILSVIVFNTLFGLSTRYWMVIVTRGLLGTFCGILGPIKAYATEVCRKEHQALGMSLVTSSRAIAFVVGPAIGGFLAQPAEKYPHIFSKESIFGRFPYFLPNFTISILAMGSCIACIWLPETLHFHNDGKVGGADEEEAQISEEVEAQVGLSNIEDRKAKISSDTSLKNLLKNWQFMSSVIIYCVFSLHDVAYLESFSLWAVSKRKFKGLSLTTQDVGIVLAISDLVHTSPHNVSLHGQLKRVRAQSTNQHSFNFEEYILSYNYYCMQHSTKHSSDTETKRCCKWHLRDSDVIFQSSGSSRSRNFVFMDSKACDWVVLTR